MKRRKMDDRLDARLRTSKVVGKEALEGLLKPTTEALGNEG